MKTPNYRILKSGVDHVIIEDVGPWDRYPTITNGAEEVVEDLFKNAKLTNGQRLFYVDSEGQFDELKVKNGQFAGFAPGCPFPL
jgi:hypothetical protein